MYGGGIEALPTAIGVFERTAERGGTHIPDHAALDLEEESFSRACTVEDDIIGRETS